MISDVDKSRSKVGVDRTFKHFSSKTYDRITVYVGLTCLEKPGLLLPDSIVLKQEHTLLI